MSGLVVSSDSLGLWQCSAALYVISTYAGPWLLVEDQSIVKDLDPVGHPRCASSRDILQSSTTYRITIFAILLGDSVADPRLVFS